VLTLIASEGGEINPLVPHTVEIVVGLVAFALLYFFLAKKAFPMFEKAYAERTAAIEGGISKAEAAQAEANAALEQYKAQLADARAEAARIRDEAREQGKAIVDSLTAEARETADRITARGEEQLAAERQQVVTQLRGEIGRLAVELAERIVGESLADEDRQRRVVDRFLAELEQSQSAGTTTGTAP
jgi:F-type H+-transporting ATPase subunit b